MGRRLGLEHGRSRKCELRSESESNLGKDEETKWRFELARGYAPIRCEAQEALRLGTIIDPRVRETLSTPVLWPTQGSSVSLTDDDFMPFFHTRRKRISWTLVIALPEDLTMESSNFTIKETSAVGLANFEPPEVTVIGCYSTDSKRNYIDGARNLKFVELFEGTRNVNFDLNQGISCEKFREYELDVIPKVKEESDKLVHLRQWINLHRQKFIESRPDFVLLHEPMTRIFTTPYRCLYNQEWRIGAIKKNGTTYLRKIRTKEKEWPKSNTKFSAWGYNFDKFIVTDSPNGKFPPLKKKSHGGDCHAVVKTNIGGHEILFSGKLDGVCVTEGYDLGEGIQKEHTDMINNCKLVSIKTCSKTQQDKISNVSFRKHKSRAWWSRGALFGVSNYLIGYRDDKTGLVRDVENIPLNDLYKKYGLDWYGETGYKFLEDFLSQVKQRVVKDETLYIFSFNQNHQKGPGFEVNFEIPEDGSQYLLPNLLHVHISSKYTLPPHNQEICTPMEKYDRRRSRSPARQIFEASSPAVSQQMAAIAPKSFKYGFLIYLQNPLKRPQNIWLDCNGMLQELLFTKYSHYKGHPWKIFSRVTV
ncbi:unnamed protein product [Allacma fusca]|uniref:Decapping nuclease n=1 Tax=Allacma fusca TaxID=39272 RepID=A0A8J2LVZ3_9HEXA|nr:unnamed protein product [Allacma fusca]